MKILANDGLAKEAVALLEQSGFEVSTEKVSQEALATHINESGIGVLLVRSATQVRKELLDQCPGLRLIGRGGVGLDNIDVEYARSKQIKVINTPKASSTSVAELVIAHMFSICRNLYDSNRRMPGLAEGDFATLKKKYSKGIELRGKTLGIIGFGKIGQAVAGYALGLGVKIKAYDSREMDAEIEVSIGDNKISEVAIDTCGLEEVLATSDFLSLHVPAQDDGKTIIGENEIAKMKDGAILINTSRGGLIDEKSLVRNLVSGKLAGAALDVFEGEPNPNPEVLNCDKISLSPHIGAATVEAQTRISMELANQIIEAFQPA